MKKSERIQVEKKNIREIIMMSAWGFTLVISSFIFLFIGRWIDVNLHTEPFFMIGLLLLGLCLCAGRLYVDYSRTHKHISTMRRHNV